MTNAESTGFPAEKKTVVEESPPSHKRPSCERLIVRSLIGVLLLVMLIEAVAHVRMTLMSQRLWNELQKGERNRSDVTHEQIDAVAKRPPDQCYTVKKSSGEEKYDVYRFWGLLKTRELYVHYGVAGIGSPQEAIGILNALPDDVTKTP